MTDPRLDFVPCLDTQGLHRMAYWEWGERDNPRVVVCVHGLTRQGRDFDTLARALAADYRVVCPAVAARGRSDRAADPTGFQVPADVRGMVAPPARLGAPREGEPAGPFGEAAAVGTDPDGAAPTLCRCLVGVAGAVIGVGHLGLLEWADRLRWT